MNDKRHNYGTYPITTNQIRRLMEMSVDWAAEYDEDLWVCPCSSLLVEQPCLADNLS